MEPEKKYKLLIIDDENTILKLLTNILSPEYIIITAANGSNAVEKAKEYKPDLILLDMLMPASDRDIFAEFNKNNELKKIPVIFITDNENGKYDEDSFALEAADFIAKPFNSSIVKIRVRNQIQLISAAEAVESANRGNSVFLAKLSHEIRTPLNAILGISAMQLQNEMQSHDVSDAFTRIFNSGDLLLGIINDVVDMSMIEAGKLELANSQYNVASVINDAVSFNLSKFESKHIKFIVNIGENIPSILAGDETRIKQILNILLSNAFQCTSSGEVELSISCETHAALYASAGKNVSLIINVRDTSQGMTAEQAEKLLEHYASNNFKKQGGSPENIVNLRGKLKTMMRLQDVRFTGSSDLGMIVIHNLISMMDGEINITSKTGKGTSFTVRLVQGNIGAKTLDKETARRLNDYKSYNDNKFSKTHIVRENIKAGKVLIVDDVDINLYVAKEMLSPYGLDIDLAVSGEEALEFIMKNNYDLVFMDHIMPIMDGIETTKRIRKMGYNKLPIIALTANAVSGVKELFLENGFNGFISKPIGLHDLDGILRQWMLPAAAGR